MHAAFELQQILACVWGWPVLHSVLIDSRFKNKKALLSRVLLRSLWKFREGLLTPLVKSDHIFAGPSSGHRNNSWGYNKHDDTPLCSADGHKAHFVILIKVRGNDIQTPMQTSWNWPWVDSAAGKQFAEQIGFTASIQFVMKSFSHRKKRIAVPKWKHFM